MQSGSNGAVPAVEAAQCSEVEEWVDEVAHGLPSSPDIGLDDETANRVIGRITWARQRAERADEFAKKETARARQQEDWLLFRYGRLLEDWAKRKIAEQGGKRRSVDVPAGTAGFRKQPEKVVVDDEGAVLAWAKANRPDLIQVVERLRKAELDRSVKETGELPDAGVHVEPAQDRFYVR